jgi:UDPglucose 6-dehydrogenase
MKEKIVVVGYGWVGQANALALRSMGYSVSYFDPGNPTFHYEAKYSELYKHIPRQSTVLERDSPNTWYIVCVGDRVAEDGVQDISLIEKALDSLEGVAGHVILRSTIIPDSLARLRFDFYVPEFLHEKKAVEECITPYYFVIGRNSDSASEPSFFAKWEEKALRTFRGTPREASHIKYLSNLWNALRIAFTNEFGSTIKEPSSSEAVRDIERVMQFIFEDKGYLRYGRSFGGHCLPKDTRAYARWGKDTDRDVALIESMLISNAAHQIRENKYSDLHEWFSEWQRGAVSGWVALKGLTKSIRRNSRHPLRALRRRKKEQRLESAN